MSEDDGDTGIKISTVPPFDGKYHKFQQWWTKFMSYAYLQGFANALGEQAEPATSGGSDSVNGNVEGINITPYEQAYRTSPEYVTSRSFQLSFLRADRFDPKAAAQRIRLHFETKKELFCSGGSGEADSNIDILGRDVTLDDLTDEERKCYSTSNDGSGHFMRFLDGRDMAGRPILFGRTARLNFENLFSEVRIM